MRVLVIVAWVWLVAVALPQAQRPFPPKTFENLQVLPKSATAGDVISTMKGFTGNSMKDCRNQPAASHA